ncbi:TetR/AcrR family transcriptional regulator [Mycobacterium marseillense]|uniref:TetR/AcrR family transcriptional regulator n=1 Tax=Mycobacterium marseillense TaxID=701042 RepID=UPI002598F448|nr:TetR/AcrR family transcriptional regulator [Mycobacterium marseillense]MDM3973358.1 TetR/AcrR family transcriptional regulator [Mycobacterium marseillense]
MASEGSPRRPTRKSDRTRESILDAARTAFARKGFSGVTIRDITDLAAVTRANFYYYFSDKTELFIELGTDTYREALAVVEGFMEQGSPPSREDVESWVARYFDYLDRNGAFVIRSTADMPPDRKFRAAVARSHRRTAAALGEGIAKMAPTPPDLDPVASGLVIMAMLERSWLMVRHNEIPSMTRQSVLIAATEMLWRTVNGQT